MKIFVLIPLLLSLTHAEIPNSLLFQGYLTQGNAPLTGEQTLLVKTCDALTDGTCKTVFNGKVQAASGYYTALLENLPVMDKPYWLEVANNGTLLPSRIALTASPYALRAASSQKADSAAFAAKAGIAGKADSAGFAVKADTAQRATNANAANHALKADSSLVSAKALSLAEDLALTSLNGLKNTLSIQGDANISVQSNASKNTIQLSLNPQGTSLSGDSVKLSKSTVYTPSGQVSRINASSPSNVALGYPIGSIPATNQTEIILNPVNQSITLQTSKIASGGIYDSASLSISPSGLSVKNLQSNSIQTSSFQVTPTTNSSSCSASTLGSIIYSHTAAGSPGNFLGCRYTGTGYSWVNLN